jgi:hypothetical protein
VLSFSDYLNEIWIPQQLEKTKTSLSNSISETIGSLQRKSLPHLEGISREAIISWIERSASREISKDFGPAGRGDLAALEAEIDMYKEALRYSPPGAECVKSIIAYAAERVYPKSSDKVKKMRDDLNNHMSSLPGDVFFIHDLAKGASGGFFAILRYIRQCHQEEVAVSIGEGHCKTTARRVARLTSPYVYALTQALGKVFSDIGLPNRHEDIRRVIAKTLLPEG